MRWLRFIVGLVIAVTIHALLNSLFPNALAFFDPYLILVIYYAMGGHLFGAIWAGLIAGAVQDAYSGSIFGLHAFSLTLVGYLVAYINSRLVLRGPLAFAGALLGSVVVNELVIFGLVNILRRQSIELFEQVLVVKTLLTCLLGILIYQMIGLFLREEPIEATRTPSGW